MIPRRSLIWLAGMIPALAGLQSASAQDSAQLDAKRAKNLAMGEGEAKRLLLLMDKDQNGRVSRQEFMDFMAAEFDRLDKNGDGSLDVKELTQSRLQVHAGGRR